MMFMGQVEEEKEEVFDGRESFSKKGNGIGGEWGSLER
jgi:hypothetical protein